MTTSGTVGTTTFDIAKILEKSYRRCGIPTSAITPELIEIGKENLFLLFNNMSNRGINLWAVDNPCLGINSHQADYSMPLGTIDVLNAVYRKNTTVTASTITTGSTTIDYDFGAAQTLVSFGIKPSSAYSQVSFTFEQSSDGVTYTTLKTVSLVDLAANHNYWYPLEPNGSSQYYRLTLTTVHTVAAMTVATVSAFADITINRMNRDDYEALPNKRFESNPCLQYFFNRQMTPTMTLWPVPATEVDCISLRTHRQIQDVGNVMSATIEVPDRWLDYVQWELAAMNAVEVPQVPQDRTQLTQQMSAQALVNAEMEERDTAPIFLSPGIGVYTR